MRNDRTAQLLFLLDAVEQQHGSALQSRPETLAWLTAQMNAGLSLDQVLECYDAEKKSRSNPSNCEKNHAHGD